MENITLKDFQKLIDNIDHKNNAIDKYFYKLTEEGNWRKPYERIKGLQRLEKSKEQLKKNYMMFCIIRFVLLIYIG